MSTVQVTCALIERSGKVLVARRPEGKALAGKWEFPGGKIEPGETTESCLKREIEEELGCQVKVGPALSPVSHPYSGGTIRLIPFRCTIVCGEPKAMEHAEIAWLEPGDVRGLRLAEADGPILDEYLELVASRHGAS